MKLRNVLLAASLGVMPVAAAQAQVIEGLYIGALGGYNIANSADLTFGPTGRANSEVEFDGGWAAIGRIGYGFALDRDIGLRLELEGNYRDNSVDTAKVAGVNIGSGGSQQTYGAMVNAIFDFNAFPGRDDRRRHGGQLRLPGHRRPQLPDLGRAWPLDHG
ncbi:MAG: hypothetical protein MUC89_23885 [Acetobacteraceae bacterium]|nr:hypothetical protein [Acetobacteraceae bacterium]